LDARDVVHLDWEWLVGRAKLAKAESPRLPRPAPTPAVADDRGIYRAFGLPPGKYLVTAGVTASASQSLTQFSDAEMDAMLARLERRFPGAIDGLLPGTYTMMSLLPDMPWHLRSVMVDGHDILDSNSVRVGT